MKTKYKQHNQQQDLNFSRMDNIENNELIAKFMGYRVEYYMTNPPKPTGICVRGKNSKGKSVYEKMIFDSSWDWLMPVVHKAHEITTEHEKLFNHLEIFEIGLTTPIEEIYKAVVEFIKWYNGKYNT